MLPRRIGVALCWVYVGLVLLFLYAPLAPPFVFSFTEKGVGAFTFEWYAGLGKSVILVKSIRTSLVVAALTALITPPLALLAAMAVRELRVPRAILLLVLLPLFIPGISMGLATAFFFQQLGVLPSLWTIAVVHVMWALPFAFLIILTVMATFDPVYLEAAYVHGAGRLRAFLDIELPLIGPGVLGAAIFSMILSFNETVRTALVQGPWNTVQTYIWSSYLQIGLSPALYAVMSILIALTLALVLVLLVYALRRGRTARRGAPAQSSSTTTSSA
jgi:ABC-type spermidine/putrescine transport system permease subunit II